MPLRDPKRYMLKVNLQTQTALLTMQGYNAAVNAGSGTGVSCHDMYS